MALWQHSMHVSNSEVDFVVFFQNHEPPNLQSKSRAMENYLCQSIVDQYRFNMHSVVSKKKKEEKKKICVV
jgi:hypothetical protein